MQNTETEKTLTEKNRNKKINIGEVNTLKIERDTDFGYY